MTTPQDALPAPASGEIAVTISLPWTIGVSIKPNVLLDGVRMVNAAGRNVYPVAPGRHMLSCEVNVSGSTRSSHPRPVGPGCRYPPRK